MYYILKISPKAFLIILPNEELIITPDYTKATKYNTVGDAMRVAVKVNSDLGTHLIKYQQIG